MKQLPLFLPVMCIVFFACHKNSGSGSAPKGPKLSRYVLNRGDSVSYDIQYNSSGQVMQFTFTGNGFGPVLDVQTTEFTRDKNGNISRFIDAWPGPNSTLNPNDTTFVFSGNKPLQYTYMITARYSDIYQSPVNIRDSTVFRYNSAGLMSEQDLYVHDASVSPLYVLRYARYFVYDQNSNLLVDSFATISGTNTYPYQVYHYTYDDHPNPLILGDEALLMLDRDWIGEPHIDAWASKNNVISASVNFINDPVSNFTMQRTFVYSSSGLPTNTTDKWNSLSSGQFGSVSQYFY
jgi:hypothetical protein